MLSLISSTHYTRCYNNNNPPQPYCESFVHPFSTTYPWLGHGCNKFRKKTNTLFPQQSSFCEVSKHSQKVYKSFQCFLGLVSFFDLEEQQCHSMLLLNARASHLVFKSEHDLKDEAHFSCLYPRFISFDHQELCHVAQFLLPNDIQNQFFHYCR